MTLWKLRAAPRVSIAGSFAVAGDLSAPSGPSAPSSLRVALVGDSLTDKNFGYNLHPFFWINGLEALGAQQLVANAGVQGETISQMASRINNAYTNASPGLSGISPLGLVYFRGGTNDFRAGTSASSLESTYTTLLGDIKSYCDHVIILAVPPLGTGETNYTTKNVQIGLANTWLEAFADADPSNFTFVDDCVNIRDSSGNQLSSFFQSDTIHTAGKGVRQQGVDAAAALSTLFGSWGYTSPLSTDAADVYSAQPQWVTNHVMAGTSGTVNSGWSGQMATGWAISSNGSGIAGSVSKVSADGGDPNQTPWQRVSPSQVTRTGAGESIRITTGLSGATITTSSPNPLDMMVEIRFNSFQTAYFSEARAWVQGATNASLLTDDLGLKMGSDTITHSSVVVRHKLPRPSATAEGGATLYWDWFIAANNTGSMGSFDFRCFTIRG